LVLAKIFWVRLKITGSKSKNRQVQRQLTEWTDALPNGRETFACYTLDKS
jgi:hypothetical protein